MESWESRLRFLSELVLLYYLIQVSWIFLSFTQIPMSNPVWEVALPVRKFFYQVLTPGYALLIRYNKHHVHTDESGNGRLHKSLYVPDLIPWFREELKHITNTCIEVVIKSNLYFLWCFKIVVDVLALSFHSKSGNGRITFQKVSDNLPENWLPCFSVCLVYCKEKSINKFCELVTSHLH